MGGGLQYWVGGHALYDMGVRWSCMSCVIVDWSIAAVAKVWACSWAISVSLACSWSCLSLPHLILWAGMLCMSF